MNKQINFSPNKFIAIPISEKINNRFGIKIEIIGDSSYTLEELEIIKRKILKEGFCLKIPINNNSNINDYNKEYKKRKCKECIFFNAEYGCGNSKSKVRSKATKTSNDKGCYWGEWKNGN